MAIATGQFTIIDYNDALTLTGYIGSNITKTQMFNPDNGSYTPDWAASPYLILTPSVFRLGSSTDLIGSSDATITAVAWYAVSSGSETAIAADSTHVYSGYKNSVLTIRQNETAGLPGKDYMCKVTYHDSSTGLDLTLKIPISFSRVVNGGGIADAVAWCPNGNVFKNGSTASLKAHCDLWRGSVIDATNVSYRWFVQDASITSASQGYDTDAGAGWKLISADIANKITGVTSNEVTVYDAYVTNVCVLKCIVKDTDSGSNTYNQCFKDTVTFLDQTDTIQIQITSTGGDVFKNGAGSSTLTAKVFQAGAEIDSAGTKYTYTWTIFDKSGNASAFSGGAASKSGKSITVGDADVVEKATFQVEIS